MDWLITGAGWLLGCVGRPGENWANAGMLKRLLSYFFVPRLVSTVLCEQIRGDFNLLQHVVVELERERERNSPIILTGTGRVKRGAENYRVTGWDPQYHQQHHCKCYCARPTTTTTTTTYVDGQEEMLLHTSVVGSGEKLYVPCTSIVLDETNEGDGWPPLSTAHLALGESSA